MSMRLGTLARKINITPSQLTSFLESKSIELPSGTNTKLTEEQIEQVLEHFKATLESEPVEVEEAPAQPTDTHTQETVDMETFDPEPIAMATKDEDSEPALAEEETPTRKTLVSDSFAEIALPHELEDQSDRTEEELASEEPEDVVDSNEQEEEETSAPKVPFEIDPEIESSAERAAYDDTIEVIKPQKVVLPGLKVKGKIDLPEPKVKSEETEESKEAKPYDPNEIITTTGPKRERRQRPKNRRGKKYRKDYNPLEAERRRKAKEEKKQKEEAERRKKKAKARHYKQTVNPSQPVSAKKKKTRKEEIRKEQTSGNVLKRFWRWMNT